MERHGSRAPVGRRGHRASKLTPHREFLEAARAEKSDTTLQALCDRLLAERGVKADTGMMSRFFQRIGVTFKTYGPPRLQVILSSAPFSVCFNVSGLGLLSPAKMEIRASRSS